MMKKDYSKKPRFSQQNSISATNISNFPTPIYAHLHDRYALNEIDLPANYRNASQKIPVARGMVLEDVESGYVGEVVNIRKLAGQWQIELEDRNFHRRSFNLGPGFWLDGKPVSLLPPTANSDHSKSNTKITPEKTLTRSGSIHLSHEARIAVPSRIWVEGKHDAELISKIWGEDLAYEGIMLEELFGADNLLEILNIFQPSNSKRAGVLLDHIIPGSKESFLAQKANQLSGVLVLGHPFVDLWQAIKPTAIGIKEWPEVPRNEDIKQGTLMRLGWPYKTKEDIGMGWQRILDSVNTYTDLQPSFLNKIEALIDFVTAAPNHSTITASESS